MSLKTLIANMQATLVLPIIIMLACGAASQNPPIAKRGCLDRCNNISIPFPFGTDESCYHHRGFWVTCNQSFHNPPGLFWQDSSVEIKSILLSGQMRVMQPVAYDCTHGCEYFGNGTDFFNNPSIKLPNNFTVNSTANKLTIVGCDTYGSVYGIRPGRSNYSTGCTTTCVSMDDLGMGRCMGAFCCQTSIPKNATALYIKVGSPNNYSVGRNISTCTYGFIVEDSAFKFFPENLTNLRNVEKLPMVVDWAIGNATCEQAKNSPNYACKSSNSSCYKPDTGDGYRCLCQDGYHGNPYLSNGCQDIDECLSGQNKCLHQCVNTVGGFQCRCPKGYAGDARVDGKGCKRKPDIPKIATVAAAGTIALTVASWLASKQIKKRRLINMMRENFAQNGGARLQELLVTQDLAAAEAAPLQEFAAVERPPAEGLTAVQGPAQGLTAQEVVQLEPPSIELELEAEEKEREKKRKRSEDKFRIFKKSELAKATDGFHSSKVLGDEGGFGKVYKGKLSDNREVAIKEPKGFDRNEVDQFISELVVLSQMNHNNLVKLLGCCLETKIPLLVYEFIPNGSLSSYIYDEQKARQLDWKRRLNIALETAGVLSYLHMNTPPIIHRDIKSDNILLDNDFTAKVSNLGATRLLALDQAEFATGYLDPEYNETRKLTTKSDVYSFGVLLLELLTEKRPITMAGGKRENLVHIFLSTMQQPSKREGLLFQLVVDHIMNEGNKEHTIKVAELAQRCLHPKGEDRPSMKDVEKELDWRS